MDELKPAYSLAEIKQKTGLGRTSLYKAIAEGRLVARKCGRRTLVLADDLARFLHDLPPVGVRS